MSFTPHYALTPRMARQLIAAERTQGFLEALELRPAWLADLHDCVRIEDALASVQIEGASLTLTTAFELARQRADGALRGLKEDEKEFVNYLAAFDAIDGLRGAKDYVLSAGDVRQLHHLLLDGVRGGDYLKGEFRREDVVVGDRVDGATVVHHQPPAWSAVTDELEAMLGWLNGCVTHPALQEIDGGAPDHRVHPVIAAGIAQHRLVWIHLFRDGNGRTARMFTTLLLYTPGYDFKYLFDLSSYYNDDRDNYYAALRTADATGHYTRWLECFMGGFAMQMYQVRQRALQQAASDAQEI